jgi:Transposase, Mutator family
VQTLGSLDDLIQRGARQIIQQAIEAELATLLEQGNVKTLDGRRAVVLNGYLPEREVVTAIGPVPVKVPKVRDRSSDVFRILPLRPRRRFGIGLNCSTICCPWPI